MKDKVKSITEIIKVQIKPTKEQIALLDDTAYAYMNACNFVSRKAFELNMKRNAAEEEGRKQVCDLGLLSTSPKCNVTFDSKPKAKKRKTKGAAAQDACHWTVANQLPKGSR